MSDSESGTENDVKTDEEWLQEEFTEVSDQRLLQDIGLDPRIRGSDHEDDAELSTNGNASCDTDEDEEVKKDELNLRLVDKGSWCKCGNCDALGTEIECYCCQESTHIRELILDTEKVSCVTDCELFTAGISNRKMLQMCSFGMIQKHIPVDKDGNIKPKGLRHAAYRNFLNMCELRFIGKDRRYALPACAIMKIRSLYPSDDGKYKAFVASEFVSRI